MEKDVPAVKKAIIIAVSFFLLAILVPAISLFDELRPQNEILASWFQRSGSLVVLLALFAEYQLLKIREIMNPSGLITKDDEYCRDRYGSAYDCLVYVGLTCALFGTLIWGYGDLIVKLL